MHGNRGVGLVEILKNPKILFPNKEGSIMEETGVDQDMMDRAFNDGPEFEMDKKKKEN